MVNPNLEAILAFLTNFLENTSAYEFIYAAFLIAVIGYGWCAIWKGIKIAGDVIRHLKPKDWEIE